MEKKIVSLPLRESAVMEKSMEWFRDPEPCIIHKTAVMKRMYLVLEEYCLQQLMNGVKEIFWEQIPEDIRWSLDVPFQVSTLRIHTM